MPCSHHIIQTVIRVGETFHVSLQVVVPSQRYWEFMTAMILSHLVKSVNKRDYEATITCNYHISK